LSVGRAPAPVPEAGPEEVPQLVPAVVVDVPAGVTELSFYTHKFRKDLILEELTVGLQGGDHVTCMLGVGGEHPGGDSVVVGDALGVAAGEVESKVADAAENGAGSSVLLQFGQAMFVVPTPLVGETFSSGDFDSMVADGTVRLVFLNSNDVDSKAMFESAISEGGYTASGNHHDIKAEFEDGKVALLKVGADGASIVADDESATASAAMYPDTYVVAEELAERAGLCTISVVEKGKLKLPRVMSSDLRIAGPKTVAVQENRDEVAYVGANGWRAVVGDIKFFGHAEPEYTHLQSELALSRDHLGPGAADAGGFASADAYPVYSLVVLCVGKVQSFEVVVSEVPPPDDGSDLPACTGADALETLGQGIALAREISASLSVYTPPADAGKPDLSSLNPREQAREMARLQREQVKASLKATMGSTGFTLAKRDPDAPRE